MVQELETNVAGTNTFFWILKNLGLNKIKVVMFWKFKRNLLVKHKSTKNLSNFYKNLFSATLRSSKREIYQYLIDFFVPKLSENWWEVLNQCEYVTS